MIHFVVHDEHDSVGVVVVEGVKSGQQLNGWIMDQDKEITVRAQSDIPIGHKLATRHGVALGRQIVSRGHRLGGHTWSHSVQFGVADGDVLLDELARTRAALLRRPSLAAPGWDRAQRRGARPRVSRRPVRSRP